jgi:hypothetical protein
MSKDKQANLFADLPPPAGKPLRFKPQQRPLWTENKAKLIERYLFYFVLVTKHGHISTASQRLRIRITQIVGLANLSLNQNRNSYENSGSATSMKKAAKHSTKWSSKCQSREVGR